MNKEGHLAQMYLNKEFAIVSLAKSGPVNLKQF